MTLHRDAFERLAVFTFNAPKAKALPSLLAVTNRSDSHCACASPSRACLQGIQASGVIHTHAPSRQDDRMYGTRGGSNLIPQSELVFSKELRRAT